VRDQQREINNDFSWSGSLDGCFQDCRRKYYYQYYGSAVSRPDLP
jgi:hypothetical protein